MTYTVPTQARNGLGLAGLILGIVGMLFGLVPLTFWIAGPLGVVGIILAIVGYARKRRGEATNGKTALFGIITSIIALILSIWGAVVVFGAFDQLDKELQNLDTTNQVDSYSHNW